MQKRLYKSEKEKMIAGVAGGLGEYFGIDPVLTRIAFVAFVFIHGVGIIAYIVLWIVMPKRSTDSPETAAGSVPLSRDDSLVRSAEASPKSETVLEPGSGKAGTVMGIVLIALGLLFLLGNLVPEFGFEDYWPLILVALGAGLLWPAFKQN